MENTYTETQVKQMLRDALQFPSIAYPEPWITKELATVNLASQSDLRKISIGDEVQILVKECLKIGDTVNNIGDLGIVTSILNGGTRFRVKVKGRPETGNLSKRKNIKLVRLCKDIEQVITPAKDEEE